MVKIGNKSINIRIKGKRLYASGPLPALSKFKHVSKRHIRALFRGWFETAWHKLHDYTKDVGSSMK